MNERAALLGLLLVGGIGPARLRRLKKRFKSALQAWEHRDEWASLPGFTENIVQAASAVTGRHIEKQLRAMEKVGARLVTDDDPEYPEGLRHVVGPPAALFVRGRLPKDYAESVAIVGTRKASRPGLDTAHALARDLAAVGLVIVSGMARGIDGAAHRGALDAGGRTVAVLGCGVDVPYPREHASLMEKIATGGAVVSEYPMGTRPEKHHFPARNRLIAGLSKGLVLVECGTQSGALLTANFALDYGREVMAVPGDVHRWTSHGPNEFIRQGATLVRNASDVLLALGWSSLPEGVGKEAAAADDESDLRPVGDAGRRVVAHLQSSGPLSIDEIADGLDMSVDDVAATVTWMELLGRVRREPGGRFTAFR